MKKPTSYLLSACLSLVAPLSLSATDYYWFGNNPSSPNWSAAGNFHITPDFNENDRLIFNTSDLSAYLLTNHNDLQGRTVGSIWFGQSSAQMRLNGYGLTLNPQGGTYSIVNFSQYHQTIAMMDSSLVLAKSQDWDFGDEGMTVASNVLFASTGGATYLNIYTDGDSEISGLIRQQDYSTRGSLTKNGTGTLTLSGTGTAPGIIGFMGGIDVNQGKLIVASTASVEEADSIKVRSSNASLQINSGVTFDSFLQLDAGKTVNYGDVVSAAPFSIVNMTPVASASVLEFENHGLVRSASTSTSNGTVHISTSSGTVTPRVTNTGMIIGTGNIAIYNNNHRSVITNDRPDIAAAAPLIQGANTGITVSRGATVVNRGKDSRIEGLVHAGIHHTGVAGALIVTNETEAIITGGLYGIFAENEGSMQVVNRGRIVGATGIHSNQAILDIVNWGVIEGGITVTSELAGVKNITLHEGSLVDGDINANGAYKSITVDTTGDIAFSSLLSGDLIFNGALVKTGAGALTINSEFVNAASASVNEGKLTINAPNTINSGLIAATVTVYSGGTLDGSGPVRELSINQGGQLIANTASRALSTGGFILRSGGIAEFYLGGSASFDVNGFTRIDPGAVIDLKNFNSTTGSDGALLFTRVGGVTYTAGDARFYGVTGGYEVDLDFTTTPGQALLSSVQTGRQYWNGTRTTPNGQINPGSGNWAPGTTNWTSSTGNLSAAWVNGHTAVFSRTGDYDVTLTAPVQVSGIEFNGGSYTLRGSHSLQMNPGSEIHVADRAKAYLNVSVEGSTALVKTGDGTLQLDASNNYTGGTRVEGGRLDVWAIQGLGAASGSVLATVTGENSVLHLGRSSIGLQELGKSFVIEDGGTLISQAILSNFSEITLEGGTVRNVGGMTNSGDQTIQATGDGDSVENRSGGLIENQQSSNSAVISFSGDGSSLLNTDSLTRIIGADTGVTFSGSEGSVVNEAFISAKTNALHFTGGSDHLVTNRGTIEATGPGGVAIRLQGAGHIENEASGEIFGASVGVQLNATGSSLTNRGTIRSDSSNAVWIQSGGQLHNYGTISGDVIAFLVDPTHAASITLESGSNISGDLTLNSLWDKLILNGIGTLNYSSFVTGTTSLYGTLEKTGYGSLTLDKSLADVRSIIVREGSLFSANTIGGDVLIEYGALFGGSNAGGSITVKSGATLTAGTLSAGGIMTAGGIDVESGGRVRFGLGTAANYFSVGGDISLASGQWIELYAQTGFGTGDYRLFDYTGTAAIDLPALFATAPVGYRLVIEHDVAEKEINLLVSQEDVQHWNGTHTAPTGTVEGGSGTWQLGTANWTNSNGVVSHQWQGAIAVFGGEAAGTVTVAETISAEGLHFALDGYTLSGPGSINLSEAQSQINVAEDVTATLDGILSGAGGIAKISAGTLVMQGSNSYSGDTTILNGIVIAEDTGSLGSNAAATISVAGSTAFLQVNAGVVLNQNIRATTGAQILNLGTLGGSSPVEINGASLDNEGIVAVDLNGVSMTSTGGAELINRGTIQGDVSLSGSAHSLTLYIGSSILGDLRASSVSSTLRLRGSGDQLYSQAVGGATAFEGMVAKQDDGTWTLNRDLLDITSLEIAGGRINLSNSAIGGNVNVISGTFGGTGFVLGDVNVYAGARLEASGGGFSFNDLTLHTHSITAFTIGSGSEIVASVSNLEIGANALLDLTVGAGFEEGSYDIFLANQGAVVGSNLRIISAPAGYNITTRRYEDGSRFRVALDVDFEGLQFWNGDREIPNGSIGGGDGVWDDTSENWTASSGSTASSWGGLTAVFVGSAGVVTLDGDKAIEGIHFGTDGYRITGSDSLILVEDETEFRINPEIEAEIDVSITGSGGLYKTGSGTIALSQQNSYTGDTILGAGTLRQDAAGAFVDRGRFEILGGTLDLNGHNLTASAIYGGNGAVALGGATLTIDQTGSETYTGSITGSGNLVKQGSGTLNLLGSVNHTGSTLIQEGTLASGSIAQSLVTLQGGTFSPGGDLVAAITVGGLELDGGSLLFDLGDSGTDFIGIADGAGSILSATQFVFNENQVGSGLYLLLDGLGNGFDLGLLSFTGISAQEGFLRLSEDGSKLYLSIYNGELITGPLIQNSTPVGTPTTARFLVTGHVSTGTPTESNTIRSLTFEAGSMLEVRNNLTVTSGDFTVGNGAALVTGGHLIAPGDFRKDGQGTLVLGSSVSVGGTAFLDSGSLYVNNRFSSPVGVTVAQGASLGGSGTIEGSVLNRGRLSPGNSPGTLTITGDYTATGGSSFQLEVASRSLYDQLHVGGRATLDGTLEVVNSRLEYGQKVPFLRAGSIRGKFRHIEMPSRYRGRFLVDGGKGSLLVAPESYTEVAATPNHRSVARALDRFIPAQGNDLEEVSLALDHLAADEYASAFDDIAPTYYESLGNVRIEQSFSLLQQLNQRLSSPAAGGFQSSSVEAVLTHDRDGKAVFTPLPDPRWTLWAEGNGSFGKITGVHQLPGYRYDSGGFLAGGDYRWSDQFATGFYGGYQYTRAGGPTDGRTRIDSTVIGAYATYANGGFYANGIVGGAFDAYDIRRTIDFSSIDRTARSKPDGGIFNTALNFGYDWQLGGFTLGPIAGLQYSRARVDGFTETGADSLNLRLDRQHIESLRSTLGARIAFPVKATEEIVLVPEIRATWQHEYLNGSRDLNAALDGGSMPDFTYSTGGPSRDRIFTGVGVNAAFGDRWNANLFYNATFGQGETLVNSVSGGVSWKF